jgi:hypothetical protein
MTRDEWYTQLFERLDNSKNVRLFVNIIILERTTRQLGYEYQRVSR